MRFNGYTNAYTLGTMTRNAPPRAARELLSDRVAAVSTQINSPACAHAATALWSANPSLSNSQFKGILAASGMCFEDQ